MSKNNISDFVILGGGCSALSFINQVIEQKITKYSFIVIEKKKHGKGLVKKLIIEK